MKEVYFRISEIGTKCPRRLWYRVIGTEKEYTKYQKRIMELGKAYEEFVVRWLQEDGYKIERLEDRSVEFEMLDCKFKGEYDLLLQFNDKVLVADVKALGIESYYKFLYGDLWKEFYHYVVQVGFYYFALKSKGIQLDGAALVGVVRDNAWYTVKEIQGLDDSLWLLSVMKNVLLVKSSIEKGKEVKEYHKECNECEFRRRCCYGSSTDQISTLC